MIGELIGEERGKITMRRVLPSEDAGVKVEVTFEASARILGLEATDLGTYWSAVQPTGFLYGEGQGVMMAGRDSVRWTGAGVGRYTDEGGYSFRGAVSYQTSSVAGGRRPSHPRCMIREETARRAPNGASVERRHALHHMVLANVRAAHLP